MIQFTKSSKVYNRYPQYVTLNTWKVRHLATDETKWKIPPHMLSHYLLVCLRKGSLAFTVGNYQGHASEQDVICVAPGMQFTAQSLAAEHCDLYLAEFDCNDFIFWEMSHGFRVSKGPRRIDEMFFQLHASVNLDVFQNCVSDAHLLLILKELEKNTEADSDKQHIYNEVRRYISLHIFDELTVESIANAFNYNKDYLGRIVRRYGKTTIKDMITTERLNMAKSFLTSTDYSIAKISELLHFHNVNDFHKFFRYHTNLTPANYRRCNLS